MINSDTTLILDVFRTTWNDFYRWEREDCASTLGTLRLEHQFRDRPRLLPQWMKPTAPHNLHGDILELSSFEATTDSNSRTSDDEIEIVDYTPMRSGLEPKRSEKETISIALKESRGIVPCPQYEACMPLQHNTALKDDSAIMPFIPFADDPTFDYISLCSEYDHFQWQNFMKDPNLEHIVNETVRKLCCDHGLTVDQVEETGVLPLGLPSLLRTCQRRDFLPWPKGVFEPFQVLKSEKYTPFNITQAMTRSFCNSCAIGYCCNHFKTVLPKPVPSLVTNDAMRRDLEAPCSESCFLLGLEVTSTTLTQQDQEQMLICFNYVPDMTPCDVAKLCGKPCVEAFMYREDLLPLETRKRTRRQAQKKPMTFLDHDFSFSYNLNSPCTHDGPCTKENNCPCDESGAHCTSRCLCENNCPRMWRGCKCSISKSKRTCVENRCPCFKANRECDPDICNSCNPREAQPTTSGNLIASGCRNVPIQIGPVKRTSVRQSAWGFGLFIEEAVEKNEFIDEYVGELIYEPTAESRGHSSRHRRRNYLFSLGGAISAKTVSIDSSFAGNATRYINHSETESNCFAKVWVVNGEQRIGIMAIRDIDAGEELLMDYGSSFFIDDQDPPEGDVHEEPPQENVTHVVEDAVQLPLMDHSSDETYEESGGSDSSDEGA